MATANLNLSEMSGENPDISAAMHDRARELNLPYPIVRDMDNTQLYPKHDASSLHPAFQRLLAGNKDKVGMYKDDLKALNGFVEAANSDTYGPTRENWIKMQLENFGKNIGFDLGQVIKQNKDSMDEKTLAQLVHRLNQIQKRDIIIASELQRRGEPGWQEWSDESLQRYVEGLNEDLAAEGKAPLDLSYLNVNRLRKGGFTSADWTEIFGIIKTGVDLYKTVSRPAEWLNSINEYSPLEDQLVLNDFLQKYSLDVRGRDTWGNTANVMYQMIPFMVELGLTGGYATVARGGAKMGIRQAIKASLSAAKGQGLKGYAKAVGESIGYIARGEAMRSVAYLPANIAEAYMEVEQKPVYYVDDKGIQQTLTESQADEFGTVLFRHIATGYMERVSEQMGGLVPDISYGALVKLLPKGVKKGLASRFLQDISKDAAKRSVILNAIKNNLPFDGVIGEVGEEYLSQWGQWLLGEAALATGITGLDTGVRGPGFSDEEAKTVWLASLLGDVLFRGVQVPFAANRAMQTLKWVDNHRNMVEKLREAKLNGRSAAETADFVGMTHNDVNLAVDIEGAEVLYQTAPEMAEKLGITQDTIRKARDEGRSISVSENALISVQSEKPEFQTAGETLLESAIPYGDLSVKDAESFDVSQAAQERFERISEFHDVLGRKTAEMRAIGTPEATVKQYMQLVIATARTFERYNLAEVETILDKLTFKGGTNSDYAAMLSQLQAEGKLKDGSMEQAVGDKFAEIKAALPLEKGSTPLFSEKYRAVADVLPKLANIYNSFPSSVKAADGAAVLIRNKEKGSLTERFKHLIMVQDTGSGKRDSFSVGGKIPWLPRTVETLENAQAKLVDPKTGNYAYVRAYDEGAIHTVIVSKDGVVLDTEVYDHGLMTQFTDRFTEPSRRNFFDVAWEKRIAAGIPAPASTAMESSEGTPTPQRLNKDTPSLKNVKFGIEKNSKISLNQSAPDAKGAFIPLKNMESIIYLFSGKSDASTLVHELAHHLYETLRSMVDFNLANGIEVDEQLLTELDTLEQWAKSQGGDYRENIAQAFEKYVMNGVAPADNLKNVFAYMGRLLRSVYSMVGGLGIPLDDGVKAVFDNWLATEDKINRDHPLNQILNDIDAAFGDLPAKDKNAFRRIISLAKEQSRIALQKEKNKQLKELRKQWQAEVEALIAANPALAIQEKLSDESFGRMSYEYVDAVAEDKETARILHEKGLVSTPGSNTGGRHPADLVKFGFVSAEDMLVQLIDAPTIKQFVKEYMAGREQKFNQEFAMTEESVTTEMNLQTWDNILEYLARKGGQQGFKLRKGDMRTAAKNEVFDMPVRDILNDKKLFQDTKRNVDAIAKAISKKDYTAAFEIMTKMRKNMEVLKYKSAAANAIRKALSTIRKGVHAKKGKIDGSYRDALRHIALRFGFSEAAMEHPENTLRKVIEDANAERETDGLNPIVIDNWIYDDSKPYDSYPFEQFMNLANTINFVYGEGRALVSAAHTGFIERVKKWDTELMTELNGQEEKYTTGSRSLKAAVGRTARTLINLGTKLRNIFAQAGGWKKDSSFNRFYGLLNIAANDHIQLQAEPLRIITDAFSKLSHSLRNADLSGLPMFPEEVRVRGYEKWSAEKLVALCLNMGTEKNRKRILNGYGWSQDDLNEIASRLDKNQWALVQSVWDALNKGNLHQRWQQTYREEFFSDPAVEEAAPFSVTHNGETFEIEGGYYPLEYLFHKHEKVQDKVSMEPGYVPEHRQASFNYKRNDNVKDPLKLSLSLPLRHIYEVAHYVAYNDVIRLALRVVNNHEFAEKFRRTQSFERYKAMKDLLLNIANPNKAMSGDIENWERHSRALLASAALWGSPSLALDQISSFTAGTAELGGFYTEALRDFMSDPQDALDTVRQLSGFMRDRENTKDLDLRSRIKSFEEKKFNEIMSNAKDAGFWLTRKIDMAVATPVWLAAYRKKISEGAKDREAVAYADEFVAGTQGGSRLVDMSPVQLSAIGRNLSIFMSATSALYTNASRTLNMVRVGELKGGAAAGAILTDMVVPAVLTATVGWVIAGAYFGDDEDDERATRAFWRRLIASPFAGFPIVRDIADFAAARLTGSSGYRNAIDMSSLRALNDVAQYTWGIGQGIANGDFATSVYNAAKIGGLLYGVPIIQAYERIKKIAENYNLTEEDDI